jgi:hypothetical protein
MPGSQPPGSSETRLRLTGNALWLVSVSVAFGVLSGTVSVITGLQDHSLGVFAVGLGCCSLRVRGLPREPPG